MRLLAAVALLISPMAFADSSSLAMSDGTTLLTIQTALTKNFDVTNVKIKDYSKSWRAYNPFSALVGPTRSWRQTTFSFTDAKGAQQEFTCMAMLDKATTDAFLFDCDNANEKGPALATFNKLYPYGYHRNDIVLDGVTARFQPSGSENSPNTVK